MVQKAFGLGAIYIIYFATILSLKIRPLTVVNLGHSKCILVKCSCSTEGLQVVDVHLSGEKYINLKSNPSARLKSRGNALSKPVYAAYIPLMDIDHPEYPSTLH